MVVRLTVYFAVQIYYLTAMRTAIFFLVLVIFLTACSNDQQAPVPKVDLSEVSIPFEARRFDLDLKQADFSDPAKLRATLNAHYGNFLCHFMEDILRIAPCYPDSNVIALSKFVEHPDMRSLQTEIERKFGPETIKQANLQFEEALKRWHHFFPDSIVPSVVYMNSGFNYSAFSTDSILAVGLDFYLGRTDSIVRLLSPDVFPEYIKKDMKEAYLVVNPIRDFAWHQINKLPVNHTNIELIKLLIQQGKVLYLTDLMLPETADSLKMNWTPEEWQWAEENEFKIWKEIANDKVMFRRDYNKNKKWIDFAPFTNAENLPQNAPPQLGIWIGWRMVRSYMIAHPETPIRKLLDDTDPLEIVKTYKPKKLS
jgi:hypothetical protein